MNELHMFAALSGKTDNELRSLSGKWMSAPQMAQEFAGLAERKTLPVPAKVPGVNLFLPA
jgi:hypothetical protein